MKKITTTNGKSYDTETILPIGSLDAGATGSTTVTANYGAGNVYQSWKVMQVYCK